MDRRRPGGNVRKGAMEIRVLGPLEVRDDGVAVAVGGARLRALLAVLALQANRSVSAERLAAAIWGDEVAPGAVKASGSTCRGCARRSATRRRWRRGRPATGW
jgi:hypothetical protein